MSSFFTAPASQKKRKRPDTSSAKPFKRQSVAPPNTRPQNGVKARPLRDRDDSISGSESGVSGDEESQHEEGESSSEDGEETAAERRLRLASGISKISEKRSILRALMLQTLIEI